MKRAITAALAMVVLAVPVADAAATVARNADAAAVKRKVVVVKKVTGPAVAADRWGEVTVVLKVRKTTTITNGVKKVTRRWFDISGSFTYHTDRTLFIMQEALPTLRQQALDRHSADVDIISGATYTSEAFIESLQGAIAKVSTV
ncbi:MAG: FMN-binding protein [Gaiellales bacterium]